MDSEGEGRRGEEGRGEKRTFMFCLSAMSVQWAVALKSQVTADCNWDNIGHCSLNSSTTSCCL